jgi:hypothetical protein
VALVGWFALCTVLSPGRVAATVEAALASAAGNAAPGHAAAGGPAAVGSAAAVTGGGAGNPVDVPGSPLGTVGLPEEVQDLLGDAELRSAIAQQVAATLEPGSGAPGLGPVTEQVALAAGMEPELAQELAARMDAVEPPAALGWAATARTTLGTVVPAAAVSALALLGLALAVAPRPSWPLRRAGWWALRASVLPLAAALVRHLVAGDGDGLLGAVAQASATMSAALVPTAIALSTAGLALVVAALLLDRSGAATADAEVTDGPDAPTRTRVPVLSSGGARSTGASAVRG